MGNLILRNDNPSNLILRPNEKKPQANQNWESLRELAKEQFKKKEYVKAIEFYKQVVEVLDSKEYQLRDQSIESQEQKL